MSLAELMIVALVTLLVVKPEDIPVILKKAQQMRKYLLKIKDDLIGGIAQEIPDLKDSADDLSEINFYLEKIIAHEGQYSGKYNLAHIKAKYRKIVAKEIESSKDQAEE